MNIRDFFFHLAAKEGHLSVCELIIKSITDTNPSDKHGQTPLHFIAFKGHLDIYKFLNTNYKNPKNKRDATHYTLLLKIIIFLHASSV